MGRRKFFTLSLVKKIQPLGRIPSRFYTEDLIDFVVSLNGMPSSRICMCFYFTDVILHMKFASL